MEFLNFNLPDSGLVFVAGRPAMGKSHITMKIAKEFVGAKQKCVLLMTDDRKAYPSANYFHGKTYFHRSELQRSLKNCPGISFVIDDSALCRTDYGWTTLIEDIIEHEKAKVIFINEISKPLKKVDTKIIKTLQETAKKNNVLIIAEANVKRFLDRKKTIILR